MRIWTEAAREAQRAAIRRWQPWAKSTGPRTVSGKARAAQNARRSGIDYTARRLINDFLRQQRRYLRLARAYYAISANKFLQKRTIILAQIICDAEATHALFLRDMNRWIDYEMGEAVPLEAFAQAA